MLHPLVLACGLVVLASSFGHGKDQQVQAFRTFMPGAGPSAFGVVLNTRMALCYDPLRGGVNQAWLGSLDLSPTLRAKINEPAKINGKVFYQETTLQPLRVNNPEKIPERRFKGYSYVGNGVTFRYTLDGVPIEETLASTADGRGLERRWSAPEGVTLYFLTDPQTSAEIGFVGATKTSQGAWKFTGAAQAKFLMQIVPN